VAAKEAPKSRDRTPEPAPRRGSSSSGPRPSGSGGQSRNGFAVTRSVVSIPEAEGDEAFWAKTKRMLEVLMT
jgi:hypothetical protein